MSLPEVHSGRDQTAHWLWRRADDADRERAVALAREAKRRDGRVATLYLRDGPECWYCGESMAAPTLEHLIPLSAGGPRGLLWNLVLAHLDCQSYAGTHRLAEKFWLRTYLRAHGGHKALQDRAVAVRMRGGYRRERLAAKRERRELRRACRWRNVPRTPMRVALGDLCPGLTSLVGAVSE